MRSFLTIPPIDSVPLEAATLLGPIDLGRGREQLHQTQAPQVLQRLAQTAKFASIKASNALEDIVVSDERAIALIRAPEETSYADRTEQEFAGYRDASDYLATKPPEALSLPLLLHLHRLLMQHTGDPHAGQLKASDNVIGEERPDGSTIVIFKPVPAGPQTEWHLEELVARYEAALSEDLTPKPLLVALLVLDFLAIHPFEDGNGRIARLLTTCELFRHDYGVARYASLEQRIFESKHSYYRSLRESQASWHHGIHDPWPWTLFLLRIISGAYADFEDRVIAGRSLDGLSKSDQVRTFVLEQGPQRFRVADIQQSLPDVSLPTIRKALAQLTEEGRVSAGRGRGAQWTRLPPT